MNELGKIKTLKILKNVLRDVPNVLDHVRAEIPTTLRVGLFCNRKARFM